MSGAPPDGASPGTPEEAAAAAAEEVVRGTGGTHHTGVLSGIGRRIGRRLLSSLPAILGVVVLTFLLMRVLPGDPAVFFASGPSAGQEEIEALRRDLGLDKPIPVQLLRYLGDVATGNLGRSLTTGQPVVTDLRQRLPASLELTLCALLIALSLAVPLGILAALRPGSPVDHAVRFVCTLGVCVPTFVSGLLLIYVFYYLLGWAPDPTGRIDIFAATPPDITGFLLVDFAITGNWEGWWSAAMQLLLPACTMALFVLAPLARMTRASMLAVLGSDFVRTARSVGLPRWRVVVVYALRNALLPVLTIAGIVFSTMLGANVLVEKVFSWPGVASYALDALLSSDYAPVQGFVLLMASIFVLVNLLVDILYGIADPRVSME
ncbi:ABC transporter permease [Roseomonas sp. NAR14]|uniref:ABC transporter permease n=1 Tax=Roseomonas acroporae TaxID=2937791 RepID=A0A9X1YEP0_9PROT|nr:ABC transporter permease [Roseomonas acroporae]